MSKVYDFQTRKILGGQPTYAKEFVDGYEMGLTAVIEVLAEHNNALQRTIPATRPNAIDVVNTLRTQVLRLQSAAANLRREE